MTSAFICVDPHHVSASVTYWSAGLVCYHWYLDLPQQDCSEIENANEAFVMQLLKKLW